MKDKPRHAGGRPKKEKTVGVFLRVPESFALRFRKATERTGLQQNEYVQTLYTIGDKHIPSKPKVVIRMTTTPPATA